MSTKQNQRDFGKKEKEKEGRQQTLRHIFSIIYFLHRIIIFQFLLIFKNNLKLKIINSLLP